MRCSERTKISLFCGVFVGLYTLHTLSFLGLLGFLLSLTFGVAVFFLFKKKLIGNFQDE